MLQRFFISAFLLLMLGACQEDDKKAEKHTCPPMPEVQICNLPALAKALGVDLTDIKFRDKDVVYRHAAELNNKAMQEAREAYEKANPKCVYLGPRLVQKASSPPCPKISDFTRNQLDGLRAAQAIKEGAPNWWELLPNCPCNEKNIPAGWSGGAANQTYHPGAGNCYRSPRISKKKVKAAGLDPDKVQPGQQCCYDNKGKLITEGAAAGTPDINAPDGASGLPGHLYMDVEIFNLLGWELYTIYWPPNNGNKCPKNKK